MYNYGVLNSMTDIVLITIESEDYNLPLNKL